MPGRPELRYCFVACILLGVSAAEAKPPTLYSNPAYQSPARGGPDELLLLPGTGFADGDVVIDDDSAGVPIVSRSPYGLTVRLPEDLDARRTYSLRVRNRAGEKSNAVRINDPRPLWISPGEVFASTDVAGLQRQVKIVGRNLRAATVRFTGPADLRLDALPDSTPVARYVVKVQLPAQMAPGAYSISVSRDRSTWIPLGGQQLIVQPDPPVPPTFRVTGCHPDDGRDDTPCVVSAIAAAAAAGGGTVRFDRGTWNLDRSEAAEGLYVPRGVNLEGVSARIVRGATWQRNAGMPTFTLLGDNTVRGLIFIDKRVYTASDPFNPFLQLGKAYYRADRNAASVANITITENEFDKPHIAIADAGLPLRRLFVTHNRFGAYREALSLGGNRYNMSYKFRIDDSVVAHNTFMPGSYIDVPAGQGAIASELGASHRLVFSDNTADGSSITYLYSPQDARGWRAAHFWHLNGSHESMLVAGNVATCTGDKVGDGEAFSFDSNANTLAFDKARTTLQATATSVTVAGAFERRQNDRDIDVASYYIGHWVRIVEGPGLGQARKIVAYRGDGNVTLDVSPEWDVPPEAGLSRISVGREYWQVYTIGNLVDHRQPLCQKSNRGRPKGGGIVLWGQTADSVVEGNRQYDTDGITIQQYYNAKEPGCSECFSSTSLQSFLEIRDNLIEGEYDWTSACSVSGIVGSYAVAPTPGSRPPTLSFGLSISGNTIDHADGYTGGAIVFPLTWWGGPPPHRWRLVENALIQHNVIRNLTGARSREACRYPPADRIGIHFHGRHAVSRAVLYGNVCENVSKPLVDRGTQTVRVCNASRGPSCECEAR